MKFLAGFLGVSVLSCATAQSVVAPAPVVAPAAPVLVAPTVEMPKAVKEAEVLVPPRSTPDAEFRQTRPSPGPEKVFKVPSVKRFRLAGGLQVVLAESHALPLVTVTLVVKTGSAANPKGKAGLASLTAGMLDEGTKTRSSLQIADELSFLGATLGSSAGWDATFIELSSLADKLDKALPVWAEVLLAPAFEEKEFLRVRDNLLTGLGRRKDSPPAIAAVTFARSVFGDDHPFGQPETGTESSVRTLTPADLKTFHATHYVPGNAVLVVAGDIREAEVRSKIEPLLKGWKGKTPPALKLTRPAMLTKPRVLLVDKVGAPQSSITMGLLGIERTNPDYHKALVMNHIYGGSFKRLFLNLREAKGWTYGVTSAFGARRSAGPWQVGGEFVAKHTVDAVNEILREMRAMRDEDVTDKELAETKAELIKGFPARFATVSQIASQFAALEVLGLSAQEFATYTRKIAAVTKADVRKMAQKYLVPDQLNIVVVGDRKSHEEGLKKVAELQLRDVDGWPSSAAP